MRPKIHAPLVVKPLVNVLLLKTLKVTRSARFNEFGIKHLMLVKHALHELVNVATCAEFAGVFFHPVPEIHA